MNALEICQRNAAAALKVRANRSAATTAAREQRRAAMPFTTALVDEYRAVFGEPERIVAVEGGQTIEWRRA